MKSSLRLFLRKFIVLIMVFVFTSTASRAATPIDRVVAIAGNEVITQSQLDRIIKSREDIGEPVKNADEHWEILRQLIEEQLVFQEAERKGIQVTDEDLEFALKDIETRNQFPSREALKKAVASDYLSWDQYLKNLKNQLMALKLLSREVNATVSLSEETVQSYYRAHPEIFGLPDRVKLKQILLSMPADVSADTEKEIKEKAEKIYIEAQSGTDFTQLVQEYSQGREKAQDGDLGFFKRGDLTPKIDELIFTLKEGEITPPVQTPLGMHIFKVEVQEIGQMRPFESVQQKIKERLIVEETSNLRAKWINDLWKRSFIEIR